MPCCICGAAGHCRHKPTHTSKSNITLFCLLTYRLPLLAARAVKSWCRQDWLKMAIRSAFLREAKGYLMRSAFLRGEALMTAGNEKEAKYG
ncbi:hypothetical protein AAFF_G00339570 [Aldrovandia affinis]|uniref:Uncharacterized protein n=1 Tax=Aldrovandia affinis TaxID=143900 RepID=A0AAD7SKD2_9TELE|nr:hypothetical protein AAFF_G00339570 [Aldrovandia affinis]